MQKSSLDGAWRSQVEQIRISVTLGMVTLIGLPPFDKLAFGQGCSRSGPVCRDLFQLGIEIKLDGWIH